LVTQHSDKTIFPIIQEYKDSELDIFELTAHSKTTRGTASDEYSYNHTIIQKEHLLWCHERVLKLLRDEDSMMSYAELHRQFENAFDLKVTSEALRKRMMYDMDYCYGPLGRDNTSTKITLQTRQFLLKFSGIIILFVFCFSLCSYVYVEMYVDTLQEADVANSNGVVAYMDETWVWRYHSQKKGIHKRGTRGGGPKSFEGSRLIVIDAITKDGALRADDEEDEDLMLSALWSYEYDKTGDYHDAFNGEKFELWIEQHFIPTFKAKYPGKICVLILDNSSTHSTGMTNPFTTSKTKCTDFLREWYDENAHLDNPTITAVRDGETVEFAIPEEGNFAYYPRGPSKEEVQKALFDLWEEHDDPHLVTWVEERFAELGWIVIFTPPYMCDFQPIEKYWANIKNHIGRKYFKGRTMQWIAAEFDFRARTVNTGDLVRHSMDDMNTWIKNDDLLEGSIYYGRGNLNNVDVRHSDNYNHEEKREEILKANPKFMSEAEMEVANNCEANTVHMTIVETESDGEQIV
jgi:hypothetical protein